MGKLIGSTTSPYVRRIRLLLEGQNYEFVNTSTFTEEGRAEVAKYSPTQRIPLWVEGDNVIWDSLLIAEHLLPDPLSMDTKKSLVLINEMTDSGVQLFQLRKFDTDSNDEGVFSKNNLKRIGQVLDYFEKHVPAQGIVADWLYCTLDWFSFREVYPWREERVQLVQFYNDYPKTELVIETDPR